MMLEGFGESPWNPFQPPSFRKKSQYEFDKELGHGAYGKVLQAVWFNSSNKLDTGKTVALKIIRKQAFQGNRKMVLDEIAILQSLEHRNIVKCYDWFESTGRFYITFELAAGGELFSRLAKRRRFTEKDAVFVVREILSGVQYLHSKSIAHRDIKPMNVLYRTADENSDIVIADFGVARKLSDGEKLRISESAGTLPYVAPEVLSNHSVHDEKVDMWAIGVTTHELLSGRLPFRSKDELSLIRLIRAGKVGFTSPYWKDVSEDAKDFIRKLMVRNKKERMTAEQALSHPWLNNESEVKDLPGLREHFDPRQQWRRGILASMAMNRFKEAGQRHSDKHGVESLVEDEIIGWRRPPFDMEKGKP